MDNQLNTLIGLEEERLKQISANIYEKNTARVTKEIERLTRKLKDAEDAEDKALKKRLRDEIAQRQQLVDAQQREKEARDKRSHDQAIKNIVNENNIALNELEKHHAKRISLENEYNMAVKSALSKRTAADKKAAQEKLDIIQKQLEAHEKEEELLKKKLETENKVNSLIKKSQALAKGKSAFRSEGHAAKAEAYRSQADLERSTRDSKIESGEITTSEINSYNKNIKSLENKAALEDWSANLSKMLGQKLGAMVNKMNDAVNNAIEDVVSHRTGIMARLQGLGGEYDYDGLTEKVAENLATSPYIKQQDFMKKLDEAVDKGIAYNVEQRTFLATVSDKIATTFDAFDANLLRLIRLQQADSTAARLGMEAALTKTLNSVFSDTSYLSDVYDQVSAAILDSEAIMSRDDAAEYEYVVQKWLGSLYSTGVSSNTINQIAQGLNYIGTGNVSALAGNSPLQTLFAMSASRANGLSYADLLTGGLDAAKTNELLKSMVEYLQEIAENSGNNVVKSAWGDIYQMSLADMRAVSSLTNNDISSIYAQNMSYSAMSNELNKQFNSISKRMSTGEMMSNVIDNFIYTVGSDIATSAVSYVMWEITDLIQSATGGINLPAVSVIGNMIDLSAFTVEGLMKTSIVGANVLSSIGTILGSIGKSGGLDMGIWGGQEHLTRGKIETTTNGWTSSTSGSTYVGSSSSDDMKNSSIAGATEDAEEVSDITNANNKTEHTFDEFFEEVLINGWPIHTKSVGEYSVSDLYSRMYVDKTPVPVTIDASAGVGAAVALMAMNMNKVSDVNIKSTDVGLNVTLMGLDSKFRDSAKTYLKTTFTEAMADEIKKTVIGSSSGDTNTIAKVCKKILDDSVDVVIKNTNFDNALDRYYMNGF